MELKDVRAIHVPRKNRNRIGRGPGSGWGVTAGRGYKGQGKRTGKRRRLRFEGGQMPLYRRLPKKGFGNSAFKVSYFVVNVGQLEDTFPAGTRVDMAAIQAAGLAPKKATLLKVLGFGEIKKALTVACHGLSGGAKTKIEGAKGTVELIPLPGAKKAEASAKPAGAPKAPKPPKPPAPPAPKAGDTK
jgi:large subunit ribosomal protein L15